MTDKKNNFLQLISYIGVLESDSERDKKNIFSSNILLLGYSLTILLYIPILGYFYEETKIAFYFIIVSFFIWLSGLFLSYKRLFFGAKMIAVIGGILQVLVLFVLFGKESNVQLFLLAAIPLPFTVFNNKEQLSLILSVLGLIFTYLIMQLNLIGLSNYLSPSSTFLNLYSNINIIFSIVSAVVVTIFNHSYIRLYENLLLREINHINILKADSEQQNKDFKDSINYALRIQKAILPTKATIQNLFEEVFVFYKPKDILSGDFYWTAKKHGKSYIATVDCTGHGVPGALLTVIGYELLNIIVHEKQISNPNEILNQLKADFWEKLTQKKVEKFNNDGMDISLIAVDYEKMILEFAGAYNPLYYYRDGILNELKADKISIGGEFDATVKYTDHSIKVKKGDIIYQFSDGYKDQFGGPKDKKIGVKRFKQLLDQINSLNMKDQKSKLVSNYIEWKGEFKQTDDITVVGIKI